MGKIFAALGGVLGSIKGIGWFVKAAKLIGLIKPLLQEGYHVVDEGMDIIPVGEELYAAAKLVKFGNTTPENIAQMEEVSRIAVRAAKEMQEAGKEIKDIAEVLKKAKDILG